MRIPLPPPTCLKLLLVGLLGGMAGGCTQSSADDAAGQPVPRPASIERQVTVAAATAASHRGDWPAWRGPTGDAVSGETDWSNDWPGDGPKKLWTAQVGVGFSAVSVANGRAYTTGHAATEHEGDKETAGDDTVYCFNAQTGDVLWKRSYPCKPIANNHEGGPSATPAVDGDHVYTLSKEGHLFCLNTANGDIVWKVELPQLVEIEVPLWGFSGSPRVFEDKLILDAGRLIALDKNTGEIVWKTTDYVVGYGSPVLFTLGGEPLIALLNNQFLLVVRAKDGSLVDKAGWTSSFATSATTPVVDVTDNAATIFISTGYKGGCALYDLADGKLTRRYKNKNMSNHMASCVSWKNVLFGFDGNSSPSSQVRLVALDRDSGDVLWKERGLGCGTLMRSGDRLILLSDDGRLVIAEASDKEYKPLAKAEVLQGKCWTMPVLAGGRIYCRNAAGDVVCLDVKKQIEHD
jgi:outer membrane protein assembly factor BamB